MLSAASPSAMYVTPKASFIYLLTLMYDWHEQWVDAVLSMENPPQAISTSYADHEQTGTYLISFQEYSLTHVS